MTRTLPENKEESLIKHQIERVQQREGFHPRVSFIEGTTCRGGAGIGVKMGVGAIEGILAGKYQYRKDLGLIEMVLNQRKGPFKFREFPSPAQNLAGVILHEIAHTGTIKRREGGAKVDFHGVLFTRRFEELIMKHYITLEKKLEEKLGGGGVVRLPQEIITANEKSPKGKGPREKALRKIRRYLRKGKDWDFIYRQDLGIPDGEVDNLKYKLEERRRKREGKK